MSRLIYTIMAVGLLLSMQGCFSDARQKEKQKWNISADHADKQPYGTYLAQQSLKYYFPKAKIEALPRGFRFINMDNEMKYNYEGRSVIIFEGLYFFLSEDEWDELKAFVKRGNEVMIFCSWLDERVERELLCEKEQRAYENNMYYSEKADFNNKNVLSFATDRKTKYGYEGRFLKAFFTFKAPNIEDTSENKTEDKTSTEATDTTRVTDTATGTEVVYVADTTDTTGTIPTTQDDEATAAAEDRPIGPEILGYALDSPNFVRYTIGEGHITIHAAPLVLSNYFLLQDSNEHYLTGIWHTLPAGVDRVYWNDFYQRSTESSSWDILWRHPATRLALILAIVALLAYILFEGKRKQRIIPIIPPIKNDSVSFVETVGRLYFNKGNHSNLADKMVQQFLEWIRTHYFLNTNAINEHFIHQLIIKSGQRESTVRGLMDMIGEIKRGDTTVDEAYLYQLYTTIQQFYKNNRT